MDCFQRLPQIYVHCFRHESAEAAAYTNVPHAMSSADVDKSHLSKRDRTVISNTPYSTHPNTAPRITRVLHSSSSVLKTNSLSPTSMSAYATAAVHNLVRIGLPPWTLSTITHTRGTITQRIHTRSSTTRPTAARKNEGVSIVLCCIPSPVSQKKSVPSPRGGGDHAKHAKRVGRIPSRPRSENASERLGEDVLRNGSNCDDGVHVA